VVAVVVFCQTHLMKSQVNLTQTLLVLLVVLLAAHRMLELAPCKVILQVLVAQMVAQV
jgi:hypothetical protein